MPKNLIVCADGTGNTGGKIRGTNVWKTYKAVDLVGPFKDDNTTEQLDDDNITEQRAIHDDGVGTGKWSVVKALGGAFGIGFTRNVKDLYKFLANNFQVTEESQDNLFLFGFSRGAYTVRALAGVVARYGILDGSKYASEDALEKDIGEIIKVVRARKQGKTNVTLPEKVQKNMYSNVEIKFIGVWDTVSALGGPWTDDTLEPGVPLSKFKAMLEHFAPFKFHDDELNPNVKNAYHALSIDDARKGFQPRVWDETKKTEHKQIIQQVWFPGVHSNVGGGYPRSGLSNIALYWMMKKASKHGLKFVDGSIDASRDEADPHGKLYDSRSGLAAYYRYKPRDIAYECRRRGCDVRVHRSAQDRIAQRTSGYAPCNFPAKVDFEADDGTDAGSLSTDENSVTKIREINAERIRLYFYFLSLSAVAAIFIAAVSFTDLPSIIKSLVSGDTMSSLDKAVSNVGPWGSIAIILIFASLLWDKRRIEKKQAAVSQQAWWQSSTAPD